MRSKRRCPDCREAYEQSSILKIVEARRNVSLLRWRRLLEHIYWGELPQ